MKTNFLQFDSNQIKAEIYSALKADGRYTQYLYPTSKLAVFIDSLAASFETQMFYLNSQAGDPVFSTTQNKGAMLGIVKLINYHAKGIRPSIVDIAVLPATGLATTLGFTMKIPKTSYISYNNYNWSPVVDYTIPSEGTTLSATGMTMRFICGRWVTPAYSWTTNGTPFQVIPLTEIPAPNVGWPYIDVYVNGTAWTVVPDTTLEVYSSQNPTIKNIVELILDENENYSLRFGDGTQGAIPPTGSTITITYLQSQNGNSGFVPASALNTMFTANSPASFKNPIAADKANIDNFAANWSALIAAVTSYNPAKSVYGIAEETIDDIRNNAPASILNGGRLATSSDYRNYLLSAYSTILKDVQVQNNFEFASTFYSWLDRYALLDWSVRKYGYRNLGVNDAGNVYIWTLTNTVNTDTDFIANELTPYIVEGQNPVILPGVEQSLQFGWVLDNNETYAQQAAALAAGSRFRIRVTCPAGVSTSYVKSQVMAVIRTYLSSKTRVFGASISASDLQTKILTISNVKSVKLAYWDGTNYGDSVDLRFVGWNTAYLGAANLNSSPEVLLSEKFMYFNFIDTLATMVEVVKEQSASV